MYTITYFRKIVFVSVAIAAMAFAASAQTDSANLPDRNFEVRLQALVGTNEASTRPALPANLSPVAQQLKTNFPFAGYHVVNTFLGRVSNGGNLEYKSVSNVYGKETEGEPQSFLEWGIGNLRMNGNDFLAQTFRFGARVPVMTGGIREEGGRPVPIVNYESIGLTIARVGVPVGVPTLIGTLTLPKTSGTLFLVLTVEPTGK